MALGKKTGGRQKGSLNRTTRSAREAIAIAADKLGGADRLFQWASESEKNETIFWSSIYPRLVPVDLNHSGGIHLTIGTEMASVG